MSTDVNSSFYINYVRGLAVKLELDDFVLIKNFYTEDLSRGWVVVRLRPDIDSAIVEKDGMRQCVHIERIFGTGLRKSKTVRFPT